MAGMESKTWVLTGDKDKLGFFQTNPGARLLSQGRPWLGMESLHWRHMGLLYPHQ